MGPTALAQVLRPLAETFLPADYPDLLRGLESPDDAAVWRLDDETAIVLTADFFPPVVDDAYHYGQIAAANSLSDLYAMGARPLLGINLVGFPDDVDPAVLREILRGGAEKVKQAGAVVAGGHTTVDREPKYGLAVVGTLHPNRILTKGGARPGDVLLLTKPLGTGVVTTAHRKGVAADADVAAAIESMARLNAAAAGVLYADSDAVHACTDVTGFSLMGHGHEMAHQSGLGLRFSWDALPLLPGAARYAEEGFLTGGGRRNREHCSHFVVHERDLEPWAVELLYDPQTSGGLLAAVAAEKAEAIQAALERAGEPVARIGEAVEGEPGTLLVV
jgi:selenide,water dikinase